MGTLQIYCKWKSEQNFYATISGKPLKTSWNECIVVLKVKSEKQYYAIVQMQYYMILRNVFHNNKLHFFSHLVFSTLKLYHLVLILIYFNVMETVRQMFWNKVTTQLISKSIMNLSPKRKNIIWSMKYKKFLPWHQLLMLGQNVLQV